MSLKLPTVTVVKKGMGNPAKSYKKGQNTSFRESFFINSK